MQPIVVLPTSESKAAKIKIGEQSVTLDTADLDRLVRQLVDIRSRLQPAMELGEKPSVESGIWYPNGDFRWYVQATETNSPKGAFLHVGHPGAGWVTILLPPDESANMQAMLKKWTRVE